MSNLNQKSPILQALDALNDLDRDLAIDLLQNELRNGSEEGNRWQSVNRLASQIGEIDIALEAARRFSLTPPVSLERKLFYWGELSNFGQAERAMEEISQLSVNTRNHPIMLHFLGTIAGERGDFVESERLYRQALNASPFLLQTWFALAMIKPFVPGDPDLEAMERLRKSASRGNSALYSRLLYGLAKAYHDCGDADRAFALYSEGAQIRSAEQSFNAIDLSQYADNLIRDFSPNRMNKLLPSSDLSNRVVFVNGLPRSGSTLVEQILTSHSQVSDGGEVNLLRSALIPTGDFSFEGALAYQSRANLYDPWTTLAGHYDRMIKMRFGEHGRVVDKTLGQSQLMGLLLHALPKARVIWVRRAPEDAALSCFRTFFSSPVTWSLSLENIGQYFAIEDRLFQHWIAHFPDRILEVPYEQFVSDPKSWIPKILMHAGLPEEPQIYEFHKNKRSVRTASVQQVRQPISTDRIGASSMYSAYLDKFRAAYQA
jgi:tetratricopeptide (TPR) repeat protein